MKKIIFLFAAIIFLSENTFAQFDKPRNSSSGLHSTDSTKSKPDFKKLQLASTRFYLSAGYGLIFLAQYTIFNNQNNSATPTIVGPIYFKAGMKMNPKTSVSLNVAYGSLSENESYRSRSTGLSSAYLHKYSTVSILARINFHLAQANSLVDPYFGFGMGWANRSNTYDNGTTVSTTQPGRHNGGAFGGATGGQINLSNLPIGGECTFGTAFKVYNQLYGYMEVGFAKSIFQAGLQYRL